MNPKPKEHYTPGDTETARHYMAGRDLESHGFFLNPLLQPGFDVLDAGCGPATISAGIADAVYPGHVTAMDISQAQVSNAERLTQGREILNLEIVAGSVYEMPFPDRSFDLVFSHALLEHLAEPLKAVKEFHRVTRPGGFVALCSPDWDDFDLTPRPMDVGRAIHAYRDLQETNGGNTRAGANLKQWLKSAGFTPLSHAEWFEEHDDRKRIVEYLAVQLASAGQFHHATALRNWAADPKARFRQAWKYATGVRADRPRKRRTRTE